MAEQGESTGVLPGIVIYLLMLGAYRVVEPAVERLLPAHDVWVVGTCYDYEGNLLHCRPDDEIPGAGTTVGSGRIVVSSGCFGECEPLDEPYSYRASPYNLDTWAGFAAALAVAFGSAAFTRRSRGSGEVADGGDDAAEDGPS